VPIGFIPEVKPRGILLYRLIKTVQPAQVQWLHDTVRDAVPEHDHGFSKHIFISRKDGRTRTLTNEDELVDSLPSKFESYELSNYTFEEQVNMFRHAKQVVGLHGAGLTNILWSNDVTVVEIQPERMRGMFYEIASALQHSYASVTCSDRSRIQADSREITRALEHVSQTWLWPVISHGKATGVREKEVMLTGWVRLSVQKRFLIG